MSRKLRLDDLSVESFETAAEQADWRGTVRANQESVAPCHYSGEWSCLPDQSCEETCGMTCWDSCWCSRVETCDCA